MYTVKCFFRTWKTIKQYEDLHNHKGNNNTLEICIFINDHSRGSLGINIFYLVNIFI